MVESIDDFKYLDFSLNFTHQVCRLCVESIRKEFNFGNFVFFLDFIIFHDPLRLHFRAVIEPIIVVVFFFFQSYLF